MRRNKTKAKRTYYVLYHGSKGLRNAVVQVEGGIRSVRVLQGLVNQLSEMNDGENVTILNWKYLTEDDEIVKEDEK